VLHSIEDVDGSRYHGDTLRGDSHANYLFGNGGNDTLEGRGGADTLDGGLNTDTASYEHSGAAVNVRLADPLTGAASQASGGDAEGDVLISIENLTGSAFNDTLTGNSAGNVIDGGDGADTMAGRAGNDVYFVDTADHYVIVNPFTHLMAFVAGDHVIEQANEGTDVVNASVSFTLSANVENLNLLTGAVNGTGNDLDNRITGNAADNTLNGGNGNDTLIGSGGEDHLNGGSNNDTYFVDSAGDVVFEFEDDGFDTVNVGGTVVDYAMVAHTEVLNLNAGLTATGNGLGNTMNGNSAGNTLEGFGGADTLNGNGGDDTLIGDAGNDTFAGGTGNDILTGGADADTFLFNSSLNALTNVDRITDFSHVNDTIALDHDIFRALDIGKLATDQFVIGSAAQDANDHVIYNSQTGALSYDADGVGGLAAIQFASVDAKLPLDQTDFFIV
jgi:Ca2+-binding RTX toxin-like protein